MDPSPKNYFTLLDSLARNNPRYLWLARYLRNDEAFWGTTLHPISPGRTHTIIANFNIDNTSHVSSFAAEDFQGLENALGATDSKTKFRLVFVTSVSGNGKRDKQPFGVPERDSITTEDTDPILTESRSVGLDNDHPIENHQSFLPDPEVLRRICNILQPDPDFLLRHLDQHEHLAYVPRCTQPISQKRRILCAKERSEEIRIALDQENHISAMITPNKNDQSSEASYTVLIMAGEDDCLGIDFCQAALGDDQARRYSGTTLCFWFEAVLKSLSMDETRTMLNDPRSLVFLYGGAFSRLLTYHVELLRKEWEIIYAPNANTSAVYGTNEDRDEVRRIAKKRMLNLRYINLSLLSLRKTKKTALNTTSHLAHENNFTNIDPIILDFEWFKQEINALKTSYDQFLAQQVEKLALKGSREAMCDAQDLKSLSFLGFIFVPLSLSCSFFSINVVPLHGAAPLWTFVITALAILFVSATALWLTSSNYGKDFMEFIGNSIGFPRNEAIDRSMPSLNPQKSSRKTPFETKSAPEAPTHTTSSPTFSPSPPSATSNSTKKLPEKKTANSDQNIRRQLARMSKKEKFTPSNNNPARRKRYPRSPLDSPNSTGPSPSQVTYPMPADHKPTKSKLRQSSSTLTYRAHDAVPIGSLITTQAPEIHSSSFFPVPLLTVAESPAQSTREVEVECIPNRHISQPVTSEESSSGESSYEEISNSAPIIFDALYDEDTDRVKELLDSKVNLGIKDETGRYPLQVASAIGNLETILLLLKDGRYGGSIHLDTALSEACEVGSEEIVRLLLDWGAKPENELEIDYNVKSANGRYGSPGGLARAAEKGNMNIVQLMIDNGADLDGPGVLACATAGGHLDILEKLIKAGAKIDVEINGRYPFGIVEPLSIAVETGKVESMRFLIKAGINLGRTHGSPKATVGEHALLAACSPFAARQLDAPRISIESYEDMILQLIEAGVNMHYKADPTSMANTMTFAAQGGSLVVMRRILEGGADPDWKSYPGSPLC